MTLLFLSFKFLKKRNALTAVVNANTLLESDTKKYANPIVPPIRLLIIASTAILIHDRINDTTANIPVVFELLNHAFG